MKSTGGHNLKWFAIEPGQRGNTLREESEQQSSYGLRSGTVATDWISFCGLFYEAVSN
jgi:hypothetical protein